MADRMSDRLPPQDLDAEQATLGAMLMESVNCRRGHLAKQEAQA